MAVIHYQDTHVTLYPGDALETMRRLPDACVDAVLCDPPYSSGGMHRSDRVQAAASKYVLTNTKRTHLDFCGDNRDQRSFLLWCMLWQQECLRLTKPGGFMMCFIDWRQLPTLTDALQCAGWVWRGIVPWDKTEATRPQMGFFRAQCEYIVTASHGNIGREQDRTHRVCLPGIFREGVNAAQKRHMTGKPVPLLRRLLEVVPPGGTVLDPFAGSGTTLVAAKSLGLHALGCEMSPALLDVAAEWCAETAPPA